MQAGALTYKGQRSEIEDDEVAITYYFLRITCRQRHTYGAAYLMMLTITYGIPC